MAKARCSARFSSRGAIFRNQEVAKVLIQHLLKKVQLSSTASGNPSYASHSTIPPSGLVGQGQTDRLREGLPELLSRVRVSGYIRGTGPRPDGDLVRCTPCPTLAPSRASQTKHALPGLARLAALVTTCVLVHVMLRFCYLSVVFALYVR